MDCRDCDIPDVACFEQCRDEKDDECYGCFGASFNDCESCRERKEKKMNVQGALGHPF